MYKCPHCGDLSISALTQFSPPFDSKTKCPSCAATVKVKFKLTNLLVVFYMAFWLLLPQIFGSQYRIDSFVQLIGLTVCVFLQIRFVEYKVVKTGTAPSLASAD